MYEAHLADPIHGEATAQHEDEHQAVELAFRQLAKSWANPDDKPWPEDEPMFDGEIRTFPDNDTFGEVWWNNHEDSLIGTVRKLP